MRSGPKTASGVSLPDWMFSMASPTWMAGHVDLVAEDRGQGGCAAVERHRLATLTLLVLNSSAADSCAPVPTPVVP